MAIGGFQCQIDEHVFLIGRPPLAEYVGFIEAFSQGGQNMDRGRLASEWRSAHDHIRRLEESEKGYADNPTVCEIPETAQPLRQQALVNPLFRRAYTMVPSDVGMVELDRLVVYQKHINLGYVRQIRATLGDSPSIETIFRMCLPLEEPVPEVQVRRVAPGNAYVFFSPSNDLRFIEPVILRSNQLIDYQSRGRVAGIVGLVVGFSPNCLSVIHAENRMILGNGSHRAFALREMGIARAPCVIQEVSRREELPMIAGDIVGQDPDLYLKSDRPPLLKDYFDQELRKLAKIPRQNRQVKIVFIPDVIDV